MKKLSLLIVAVCFLLLAGTAGADTFNALALYVPGLYSDVSTRIIVAGSPVLGVSSIPGGPLLNNPDYSIPSLVDGVYYLYAGQLLGVPQFSAGYGITIRFWGPNPVDPDNPYRLDEDFTIQGTSGTFELWTPTWTSDWSWPGPPPPLPTIYMGWAQGTADLMNGSIPGSDGINDAYMVLGFNQQPTAPSAVPEPTTMLLLVSGLMGLVGLRRKFKK